MLDRLSGEASQAVSQAREEAFRLGHGQIGTEHLLLGLLGETGTAASRALHEAGVSLASVREKVIEALASRSPGSPARAARDLSFSDRATRALDRAGRLSLRMGRDDVGCEHILISVLDVEGTAGQVLRGLGVDPEAVRQALASAPSESPPARGGRPDAGPAPAAEASAGARSAAGSAAGSGGGGPEPVAPRCGVCGATLEGHLRHATVSTGSGAEAGRADVFYCSVCGTAIGAASI